MNMFTVLVNMELQKMALDMSNVPDMRNLPDMNMDIGKVDLDVNKVNKNLQNAQTKLPKNLGRFNS